MITRPDAPAGRGRRRGHERGRATGARRWRSTCSHRPDRPIRRSSTRSTRAAARLHRGRRVRRAVPASALAIPVHGWVNLHFSLLPAWRGAAPVQHAILHGDDITGATTFVLEAGLDTGPVLGVLTEEIRPRDTAGDLLGPPVDRRRRACCWPPSTASRAGTADGGCPVARRREPGAEAHPRRRAHRLEHPGDARRPARSRVHASTRGLDDVSRPPDEDRAGAAGDVECPPVVPAASRAGAMRPGSVVRCARWRRGRVRRHGDRAGVAHGRADRGQGDDIGGRVGPGRSAVTDDEFSVTGLSDRVASPRVPADPARVVALDALRTVREQDAYANLVLPGLLASRKLDTRDAAFVTELVYGTLARAGHLRRDPRRLRRSPTRPTRPAGARRACGWARINCSPPASARMRPSTSR